MTTDDYLALDYTTTLKPDRDDQGNHGYVAAVAELPGCVAQGDTEMDALANLREAKRSWLDAAVSSGAEIPRPREEPQYSGRVLLRMPVSLHAELARAAEAEGTSLNQFLVGSLAGAVGWRAVRAMDPMSTEAPSFQFVDLGSPRSLKVEIRSKKRKSIDYVTIDALPLTDHSVNTLKRAGVGTVGELVSKKPEELTSIQSFGEKSLDDVRKSLNALGLKLTGG